MTKQKKSRTGLTKKNAAYSIINRIVTLVCNFICRSVFINILGSEYLGAGGMFGNVFAVLSLAELGFGEAVSQSLYKPLAENDTESICRIMHYFAKVYRMIGLVTLALCTAVMPFLPLFFSDIETIERYRAVYLLFAVHQVLSYYFAPKRALVMCDQRMYAIMAFHTVSSVLMTVAQVVFLYLTNSYLIYIFLRIFFLALDGFAVNAYADRVYPFLVKCAQNTVLPVNTAYKAHVWKSTQSLILHRIGGVINSSTDSILISSHLGLAHMGVFSNYSLIIHSLGSFVALAVGAASASIGNLGVTESNEKSIRVLRLISFGNFVLLTNCSALLVNLIAPFITLWIGAEHCFGMAETAVIIACFYMSYIRDPVQIYLHSYGVFKSTGYLYLARGILNLALSLVFVMRFGAVGVFAGTLVSTAVTAFFCEPPLLFRSAFGVSPKGFMKEYYFYPVATFLICAATWLAVCRIEVGNFVDLAGKGAAVFCICNSLIFVFYGGSDRFKAFLNLMFRKGIKKRQEALPPCKETLN
ncbi:MAG: lipopolysaccharide biosynthesis protein [Eubacteriales bacterium]